MGLFMVASLLGTIAYGSHLIKNEIESTVIDSKTKVTSNNVYTNKEKIKNNFSSICRRNRIKIKNGQPIHLNECEKGMAYLRYQGYSDEEVNYFKSLFENKYKAQIDNQKDIIRKRFNRTKNIIHYTQSRYNRIYIHHQIVYNCYSRDELLKRMNTLLNNSLWNEIVLSHSYVINQDNNYEEVWRLSIPNDANIDILQLYYDVCSLENIRNDFY